MIDREKIMKSFVDFTKMIKNPHIEELKELTKEMDTPALKAFFMSYYSGAHDMKDRIMKAVDECDSVDDIKDIIAGM